MGAHGTPAGSDFDGWVQLLARDGTRQRAKLHLWRSGTPTVPALRRGLQHPSPHVRRTCVNLLDHFLDEGAVADLISAMDDPDATVAGRAIHALACDACKEGACRPGEDEWVPRALAILESGDADRRAAAIDALGKVAGHRPDVADALRQAGDSDADRGLRSMARRRAGGRV